MSNKPPSRPVTGESPAPEVTKPPCPKGYPAGHFGDCFSPFRYCPEKGCGRTEKDDEPPPLAEVTQDDKVRTLLGMARKRAESVRSVPNSLDVAEWPRIHRHYAEADTCEHGERLNVGWLELGQEAENAQQILDFAGIPDGNPQGRGDVDWRVAEAVLRLMDANGRLSAIASAHVRETGPAGTVGDYCIECDRRWPCPTYLWADGQRDTTMPWHPLDDDDEPHPDVMGTSAPEDP